MKFAGPLKAMLRALLISAGCPIGKVERYIEGDLKEVETPYLAGRTPRHALQSLGTEWGRKHMRPTFWQDLTMQGVAAWRGVGSPVVIDDMRFPNEAEAIRGAGGLLIRLVRPSLPKPRPLVVGHVSEGGLDHLDFDLVISNEEGCPTSFGLRWAAILEAVAYGRPGLVA